MIAGYRPTPECLIIEEKHNKHHCFVPPEVWEIPADTVCAVCRLKNHRLFVEAAMSEQTHQAIPDVKPFSVSPKVLERVCESCGNVQLLRKNWDNGERVCGECQSTRPSSITCRICGTTRGNSTSWWSKAGLCSRKACWERYMAERKVG